MTPVPPGIPPNPSTDGGVIGIIGTIVAGVLWGIYAVYRRIRESTPLPSGRAVITDVPDKSDNPDDPIPDTPLSDDEDIRALQIALEVFKTETNQKIDELDARIDYNRRLAIQTAQAMTKRQDNADKRSEDR